MGMSVDRLLYLHAKGVLQPGPAKLLDIGPQNVYHATAEQIRSFVKLQGQAVGDEHLEREVERLVYFSTPRPDERTTFVSEITDLTELEYHSYDICPGLKTDICDLNFDGVLPEHRGYFDVVLNFGTTEHVFNQWNSFSIIHDAVRVGGYIYHNLPATGYLDHGYFCYTPVFFNDMAAANDYEMVDLFFTNAGHCSLTDLSIDVRRLDDYMRTHSDPLSDGTGSMASFNVHAVMRKTRETGFRCGAEIATAHAPIDPRVRAIYDNSDGYDPLQRIQQRAERAEAQAEGTRKELLRLRAVQAELDAMRASTSWRITRPLRTIVEAVRGR